MRILVKKGSFEFEIDDERVEDYLVSRHYQIGDVNYIRPFFENLNECDT